MNYIRHLNAFFSFVRSDNRLTSSHVSLYLALFQYWNFNRFQNPFPVYRQNIMQLSKIGSKNTYHKCLKELHLTGYIKYQPSSSKFQPVKISMMRLDIHEEKSKFQQLDMFALGLSESSPPDSQLLQEKVPEDRMRPGQDLERDSSPISGTGSVPDMSADGTDINTSIVPKSVHSLKQNLKEKNSVQYTPNKIFKKNEEIQNKINKPPFRAKAIKEIAGVPNMRHVPTLPQVQQFFKQNKYSVKEAQKFFYYNQGKNWMLTEKLPITDWQSMAHKWILNSKSTNLKSPSNSPLSSGRGAGGEAGLDIQYLYERLLDGKQISKSILIEHYDYLRLQVTEEVKHEAWQRRINQLTGSNENSENQLLEAYQSGDKKNNLVIRDEPNLMALAKRVAVFNYLKKLQQEGKLNVL